MTWWCIGDAAAPDGVLALGREQPRLSWRVSVQAGSPAALRDRGLRGRGLRDRARRDRRAWLASSGRRRRAGRPLEPRACATTACGSLRPGWSGWSDALRSKPGCSCPPTGGHGRSRCRATRAPRRRRHRCCAGSSTSAPIVERRLHVTALGLHPVTINGQPVTEDLLAPGWTPYDIDSLPTPTTSRRFSSGPNVIGAALGDGWYRGRLGWAPTRSRPIRHGGRAHRPAGDRARRRDGPVVARRELAGVDRRDQFGRPLRRLPIDLRDGSAAGTSRDSTTRAGSPRPSCLFDRGLIEPRIAPPVRRVERPPPRADAAAMEAAVRRRPEHRRLAAADGPWQRRRPRRRPPRGGPRARRSLHTRPFGRRKRPTRTSSPTTRVVLEPTFTFHGFRYAEVETTPRSSTRSSSRSAATCRRGVVRVLRRGLTRLHENVVWSQRDNFVSVPTDCPQRDERLGWTGDAQAFAPTATLFESEAFWTSWLRDLALEQDPALGVPTVVPDVVLDGEPLRASRLGRRRDDRAVGGVRVVRRLAVLERQIDSMRAWIDSLSRRRGPDGLLSGDAVRRLARPGRSVDRPWEAKADSTSSPTRSSRTARDSRRAAAVLGRPTERRLEVARSESRATWAAGPTCSTTQTGCAIAMQFGRRPEGERDAVAARWHGWSATRTGASRPASSVRRWSSRRSGSGHFDACYRMLLRREPPSWLYQVDRERPPSGSAGTRSARTARSITAGWRRRRTIPMRRRPHALVQPLRLRRGDRLGVSPSRGYRAGSGAPGYRHVIVAPIPFSAWRGRAAPSRPHMAVVSIDWRSDGEERFVADVELPFGTTGEFTAPATAASVVTVDGRPAGPVVRLEPGHHTVVVTSAAVADPARSMPRERPAGAPT